MRWTRFRVHPVHSIPCEQQVKEAEEMIGGDPPIGPYLRPVFHWGARLRAVLRSYPMNLRR